MESIGDALLTRSSGARSARFWPWAARARRRPATSAAIPDTIRNTAKRDADFAAALEQAETQHEIQASGAHQRGGQGGTLLARRGLGAGTHESRSLWPATSVRDHRRAISQVLAQFAAIILEEVTAEDLQQRIFERLSDLTEELQALSTGGDGK